MSWVGPYPEPLYNVEVPYQQFTNFTVKKVMNQNNKLVNGITATDGTMVLKAGSDSEVNSTWYWS